MKLGEIASLFVQEMGLCGKTLVNIAIERRELWYSWKPEKVTPATIRFEPNCRIVLFKVAGGWNADLLLKLKDVSVEAGEGVQKLDLRLNALNFPIEKIVPSYGFGHDQVRRAATMTGNLFDEFLATVEELSATDAVLKKDGKLMGVDNWKWLAKRP